MMDGMQWMDALHQLGGIIYIKWAFFLLVSVLLVVTLRRQNLRYQHVLLENDGDASHLMLLEVAVMRGKIAATLWCMLVLTLFYRDVELQLLTQQHSATQAAHITSLQDASNVMPDDLMSEASRERDIALNRMKATYEDAFVSYMILQKCEKVTDEMLLLLQSRLQQHIVQQGEDVSVAQHIIDAAKGSYDMLYSQTPCSAEFIEMTEKGFKAFLAVDESP